MRVDNPILSGFHPDPAMTSVDGIFYLATSTFEWWPGVRLFKSANLVDWELIGYALDRKSQLEMRGNPASCGVWAPALSYADGKWWLIYSNVRNFMGRHKDVANYLVTADSIEGPWSDPIFLNCSGFDPSLFHGPDGRKWVINQWWDPRPRMHPFRGILLQEYSVEEERLVGEAKNIFEGSPIRHVEGPHIYFHNEYYYLVTAEGGTELGHAVTVARSRNVDGPYELHPNNPMTSARHDRSHPLQKAGHGSFAVDRTGRWWLVHLVGRPVKGDGACILGRETALNPVRWEDDWPWIDHSLAADAGFEWDGKRSLTDGEKRLPVMSINIPDDVADPGNASRPSDPRMLAKHERFEDNLRGPDLHPQWNTLREPAGDWLQFDAERGLRLEGQYSLSSDIDISLVARRVEHKHATMEVTVDYDPTCFQHQAGLTLFYNSATHFLLRVSFEPETDNRTVHALWRNGPNQGEVPDDHEIAVTSTGPIRLRAVLDDAKLHLYAASEENGILQPFQPIATDLDATILSDEKAPPPGGFSFTGTFVGLFSIDLQGFRRPAHFRDFVYHAGLPG